MNLNMDMDLSEFFSRQELDAMSRRHQTRLKKIAQNYERMLHMGLPAIKPDFMNRLPYKLEEQTSFEPVKEEKNHSQSDTEDTMTLGSERTETGQTDKASCDGQEERKAKSCREVDDSIEKINVNEPGERKTANVMQLDVPDDDCEECDKEYSMDCPIHGPLDYVRDTEVYAENDPERALHTLPPGLVVKESGIEGSGLGVFTEKEIPPRVMFGPYCGVKISDEKASDSGYCWQIYADGKPSHFVDAKDKTSSNWMRYVNCTPSESEQNLEAFQFRGGIYYRSYRTIHPGTELVCWYGDEYGRELGLVRDKNLLIKPELVHGKECYPCVFCKTTFTKAVHNISHLVRTHGTDKLTTADTQVLDDWLMKGDLEECTESRKNNTQRNFGRNNEVSNSIENIKEQSKMFKCDKCSFISRYSYNLIVHTRKHTGEKCFKCGVCDYACYQSSHLKSHLRIHTGEKCFKCGICDYACNYSSNLKTHMRIHSEEKCFKCDVCEYACNQRFRLKTHMAKHTGEKYLKCDICDYACIQSRDLESHMAKHTGEKCFKCDVCDYECVQNRDLKNHLTKHTGEKGFICEVCGYACIQAVLLKKHMRVHTGEKCFRCDVCEYACNQRSRLKAHMAKHSGETYIKCDICDYGCMQNSDLKRHMKKHTGERSFTCHICDHAFIQRSDLKKHMRVHTGEKSFRCDICDYGYNQRSRYKAHVAKHTGEKSFRCDVCDYGCNQRSRFKAHVAKHSVGKNQRSEETYEK